MQYTALDVLIIMALAESRGKVLIPHQAFACHSTVVRNSSHFKISSATSNQVLIEPLDRLRFQKQCQRWYSRYEHDELVPFAGNGLNLSRIVENADFFAEHLFDHSHLVWNLTTNTFQWNGKILPRSGICWAWDWLFVLWFAQKQELIALQERFPLQLHFELSKRGEWLCYIQLPYDVTFFAKAPQLLHYGLAELKTRIIDVKPFKWVEKANRATLAGHLIRLNRLSPAAKNLLWQCLTWQATGLIPIAVLYAVLFGKKHPRRNKMRNGPTTASLADRQKKAVENVRDELMAEIKQIIAKYRLPWKIEIHVYAGGVDFSVKKI